MIRRKRMRRHGWQVHKGDARLKMTSMMDILTVLLLFLLKSFVVDAELLTPPPEVELPSSTSETPPEASLVVAISDDVILLGGAPVVSVHDALSGSDLLIGALEDRLDQAVVQIENIAERKGRAGETPRMITIQGDKDIEFRLLQRVMYTCNASGFEQLSLAVVQDSRKT
jgi:biopolymer transport protein ExbD